MNGEKVIPLCQNLNLLMKTPVDTIPLTEYP